MPKKNSSRTGKSTSDKKNSSNRAKRHPESKQAAAGQVNSGSRRSTLDPRRNRPIQQDENAPQTPTGRLSGDVQNLSQEELADSESVEELVEEGQDFEGELIQAMENAPPADQGEIRTHAPAEPNEEAPDYKNRNRL
jgi:hypothetical protein